MNVQGINAMVARKDSFSAITQRAIQRYQEITDETLDVEFLTKIQNVEDLTREINERNTKFRDFREKRGAIFDALQAALLPVEQFGSLAARGAALAFPPSSLIFGAVTNLMGAAKGVSASYDAIEDLMGSLKVEATFRFSTRSGRRM
jgi:hypothetical protein